METDVEQDVKERFIKVKSSTAPNYVSRMVEHILKSGSEEVVIRAAGRWAVTQAVKGIASAGKKMAMSWEVSMLTDIGTQGDEISITEFRGRKK